MSKFILIKQRSPTPNQVKEKPLQKKHQRYDKECN